MVITKEMKAEYFDNLVEYNQISENTRKRYREFLENLPEDLNEVTAKTYINFSKTNRQRAASSKLFTVGRLIHLLEALSYGGADVDSLILMLNRYQRDVGKRWRREMRRANEAVLPVKSEDLHKLFVSGKIRLDKLKRSKSRHHYTTHRQMMIALGLMVFCGNRIEETLSIPMSAKHIDITPKHIRIKALKSKGDEDAKPKVMYVTRNAEIPEVFNLYNELLSYIEEHHDKSWLFFMPRKPDVYVDYLNAYRKIEHLCRECGIERINFHQIRHFVGASLSFNMPERAIGIMLNHSDNPNASLKNRYQKTEDFEQKIIEVYRKSQKLIQEEIS